MDMRRLVRHIMARSLLLIVVLAGASFWQLDRLRAAVRATDRSDEVIAEANRVQKLILDQETGLRGYFLTEERAFLGPYEHAKPLDALARLEQLVADDPEQRARASALVARYRTWVQQAAAAVEAPARARATPAMLARKADMDDIRALVSAFIQHEEALRVARTADVTTVTEIAEAGTVGVLLVVGAALVLMSRQEIQGVVAVYDEALRRSADNETAVAAAARREREAREQAEAALRTKDEFLWTLSHELRTPLTAVVGWASMLRSKRVSGPALDRALASLERAAQTEARIVDDLLDASRIATGKIQLAAVPTTLDEAVAAAVELIRDAAANRGVHLEVAPAAEPVQVVADPHRLQQIVWNLLSNAVKFTPRGGRVTVCTERDAESGRALLRVRDTGIGITPEFLPHVFERFRQDGAGLTRAHGGLGLGLAIVKHFVEMHGGTIRAESEGPGRGATFTVCLPTAEAREALPSSPQAEAPAADARPLRGLKVLLVEDDPDAMDLTSSLLRDHGAEVQVATRGDDALRILSRERVDVLVSDIGLPDVDGYALLQRARARAPAPARPVPALALTAYADAENVKRAHLAGFERHLAKPFSPEHLVRAVADLAGG